MKKRTCLKKTACALLAAVFLLYPACIGTGYAQEPDIRYDFLLDMEYKNLHCDGCYVYAQTQDNMLAVFDLKMEPLFEFACDYSEDYTFCDGVLCVKKDGLYGGLDTNGTVVVDFLYSRLSNFSAGRSTAILDGRTVIIDASGTILAEYAYASAFINGYAFVCDRPFYDSGGSGRYLVCSIANTVTGDKNYPKTSEEKSGFALIDANFNVVFDQLEADIYEQAGAPGYKPGWGVAVYYLPTQFNEQGIAVAKRNGKYGLINTKGEIIQDFTSDTRITTGETHTGGFDLSQVLPGFLGGKVIFRELGGKFIDGQDQVVYYVENGKSYRADGTLLFDSSVYIKQLLIKDVRYLYKVHDGDGKYGILSVNEAPEPAETVDAPYICFMKDNPILNVSGELGLLEKGNFFVAPLEENDRILTPLRAIAEAMGADVEWDEAAQTVTVSKDSIRLLVQIGRQEMYRNGRMVWLDTPARLVGDRTFVPLRAVAEGLGAKVTWDASLQAVTVMPR